MPIYMKYEGIKGPVTGKYADWIELQSCQIEVHHGINTSAGSGAKREANNPPLSEIVITKYHDSSSNALFEDSLSNKVKKVTIDFVTTNGETYRSIELANALISGYSISGHGGDSHDKPMESLSLNFTKITYSPKPTAPAKDPKATKDMAWWDFMMP
jgi:type VI secretion system secreted protein Hcp